MHTKILEQKFLLWTKNVVVFQIKGRIKRLKYTEN